MFIFQYVAIFLFNTFCAWFGAVVVKLVTLGKVDLDWKSGSESVVSEVIGLFVVLLVGGSIAWIVHVHHP